MYITRQCFNKDTYDRIVKKYCKQEDKLNSSK